MTCIVRMDRSYRLLSYADWMHASVTWHPDEPYRSFCGVAAGDDAYYTDHRPYSLAHPYPCGTESQACGTDRFNQSASYVPNPTVLDPLDPP